MPDAREVEHVALAQRSAGVEAAHHSRQAPVAAGVARARSRGALVGAAPLRRAREERLEQLLACERGEAWGQRAGLSVRARPVGGPLAGPSRTVLAPRVANQLVLLLVAQRRRSGAATAPGSGASDRVSTTPVPRCAPAALAQPRTAPREAVLQRGHAPAAGSLMRRIQAAQARPASPNAARRRRSGAERHQQLSRAVVLKLRHGRGANREWRC